MSTNEDNPLYETLLTTDLRDNLPPQLLAVIAGVLKLVEGIEPIQVNQEEVKP